MSIRTYTGKTMAEALALVKRELGAHAVVLHTRSYKRGGVLGLGARPVVELTAADGRELGRKKRHDARRSPRAQALQSRSGSTDSANAQRPTPAGSSNVAPVDPPLAGDLIRRTYQAARAQFDSAEVRAPQTTAPSIVTTAPPPSLDADQHLSKELAAVKQLVEQVARSQQKFSVTQQLPELPDNLVEHYAHLIEQEVATELAQELLNDCKGLIDQTNVRQSLHEKLTAMIPVDPQAGQLQPTADARPRVIALVGPTGVGKTTTLAKLAATFKLKQQKQVGLITADTYRIAAVDQLRTYASIIGLPLEVVSNPDELAAAMDRLAACDAILIDTAGRSQRDTGRLDELKALLATAQPHETHLVLSAVASQKTLLEVVDRFSGIATDRLIFTKIDEAAACGVLLNIVSRVGKPLSYITTGQEVPHQIESGSSQRLAELVLGAAEVSI